MSAQVDQVDIPGSEGQIGVLPNHSPLMTVLAPGVVRVKDGSDETRVFLRGGFAEISPAGLTVLAEEAVLVKDLDAADIARRIKNCEDDLSDADTLPETRRHSEIELQHLKQLQSAV